MRAVFEQPKHLNAVCYQRLVRTLRPLLVVGAVILSGLALTALWRRAEAGQQVSGLNWVLGACAGLCAAMVCRLTLRFDMRNRRYLEFRDEGLFLSGRGFVNFGRVLDSSISPDPIEPRYTRVRLTYKCGFGGKHWTMLLDDAAQISELRNTLKQRIPRRTAA